MKTIERQIRESIRSVGFNVYEQLTPILTKKGWDKGWRYDKHTLTLDQKPYSELGITLDEMMEKGYIRLETRQHINTTGVKPLNKGE